MDDQGSRRSRSTRQRLQGGQRVLGSKDGQQRSGQHVVDLQVLLAYGTTPGQQGVQAAAAQLLQQLLLPADGDIDAQVLMLAAQRAQERGELGL